MATTIKIPYYATALPSRLPTESEIDKAPDMSLEYGGRRVVEIQPHFVVKFGKGVNLVEGENMMFVGENTSIRVPRVYALYTKSDTGKKYIIMERIAGQSLLSSWSRLGPLERESITTTLHHYFTELRSLSPPSYYGSLGKRRLLDEIFWTQNPEPAINGPFDSNEHLLEAMARKYIHDGGSHYRADFYRQCLPRVLCDHRPTFTHGDFQRKNIIIQMKEVDFSDPDSTEPQVIILDWEKSGWYPGYWEYCLAICALRWNNDWCLCIEKVLKPFVSEAAWLQTICLELWS